MTMSRGGEGPTLSFKAQIAIAVIGLVGSLGGAWIASGAKFDRELDSRGGDIRLLTQALLDAREKLDEQQAKIDKIDGEIEYAKETVAKIAKTAAEMALQKLKASLPSVPSWPFGSSKKRAEDSPDDEAADAGDKPASE